MQGMPYVPGLPPAAPAPLFRFLPPLEAGSARAWLLDHVPPSSWLLDPFGFSPHLPVEAARAGYRVLVTVNNPVTRFLLEVTASPPTPADFKAALAELASTKRGEERLETHLRSLYETRCEKCSRPVQATAYLWRRGEEAPFARIYECKECGDQGQRETTAHDTERAREIAAADALHRSRALERVVSRGDADRSHVEEALQYYLPRPLYVLTTILNRIESLRLSPARQRALTAALLVVCDATTNMWSPREQTPRPKQLFTPEEIREVNAWLTLEEAFQYWADAAEAVEHVAWPNRISGQSGVCTYEGRLRGLAQEVGKEIPIAAALGSVPRPNQAFWTLSALWAGWLWGRDAVEPYRMALRRRRYDWTWNATALRAAFTHLAELLGLGTPFFGWMPELEPPFLLSAMTAISAAGFDLRGLALRSQEDPAQFVWARGEHLKREVNIPSTAALRETMQHHLEERGEPASYLHLKSAALQRMAEGHSLHAEGQELEAAMRATRSTIESGLSGDDRFIHRTTGESIESGSWGLREWPSTSTLTDQTEVLVVNHLQKNRECPLLDIEARIFGELRGLLTPPRRTVNAVLSSYAKKDGPIWRLRSEDQAARRQEDLRTMSAIIETTAARLRYRVHSNGNWWHWEDRGKLVLAFSVLASALVAPVLAENPHPASQSVLVVPGGRVGLIDYKTAMQPALAEQMRGYRLVKFRLWRTLGDVKILTRESFGEQIESDPVQRSTGQMMMF